MRFNAQMNTDNTKSLPLPPIEKDNAKTMNNSPEYPRSMFSVMQPPDPTVISNLTSYHLCFESIVRNFFS